MSLLLYVVGAIAAMLGMGMLAYGIPVHEFSFGNTLIIAGTTTAVGGVIVIAIGVAVAQLQKIAELLAVRPAVKTSRPLEMMETPAVSRSASSRVPFPPRPKSEPKSDPNTGEQPSKDMPASIERAKEEHADTAPMLRNPERTETVVEEYDIRQYEEVSLSPQQQMPAADAAEHGEQPSVKATASSEQPTFDAPWRSAPPPARPPQSSYFDTMWPAESRPPRRPFADERKFEPKPEPNFEPEPMPEPEVKSEPVTAILKSGVVDGMAYTLYVDGSIEAELPQGTLHFASINELREHLAKNS
jgi:hypothetical protein